MVDVVHSQFSQNQRRVVPDPKIEVHGVLQCMVESKFGETQKVGRVATVGAHSITSPVGGRGKIGSRHPSTQSFFGSMPLREGLRFGHEL